MSLYNARPSSGMRSGPRPIPSRRGRPSTVPRRCSARASTCAPSARRCDASEWNPTWWHSSPPPGEMMIAAPPSRRGLVKAARRRPPSAVAATRRRGEEKEGETVTTPLLRGRGRAARRRATRTTPTTTGTTLGPAATAATCSANCRRHRRRGTPTTRSGEAAHALQPVPPRASTPGGDDNGQRICSRRRPRNK